MMGEKGAARVVTAQVLTVSFLCVIGLVISWWAAGGTWGIPNPMLTAILTATFFVIRLLALHLPQGDDVRVTLVVGLFALGVLDVPSILIASLFAGLLDVAVEHTRSSGRVWSDAMLDAIRGTAVIALVSPLAALFRGEVDSSAVSDIVLLPVLLTGFAYMVADLASVSILHRIRTGRPVFTAIRLLARSLLFVYMVHVAMATVALRTYPQLGLWGFAIGLLLTLILQNSFNLYLRIRRAYSETIGALARAAELDRPGDAGHAQRVAELAVAVGRRMGLSGSELERLNYAAQLHDIGLIGSENDDDEAHHADRGAEIVRGIPFLTNTAPCIERHVKLSDPDLPLCAAIVGVCSAFDRLRVANAPGNPVEVLRNQARGVSLEVIDALSHVIERQHVRSAVTS